MAKNEFYIPKQQPSTVIIAVHAPYNRTRSIQSYFEEFRNLIRTDGIDYDEMMEVKLREIDAGYFFGKGKIAEIKELCQSNQAERVVISESLTPQQSRNLEDYLNCDVMDRTDLILDIFKKAALSAEGKTQVEIALLKHQKSRLAGKGVHMAQQEGTVGLRSGPGETAKERERRHIENLILRLKRELDAIQKSRASQRKQRLQQRVPHACLIGYTNAGKSTILNALTKSNVLAEDKLFATLDTTTRALFINSAKKGVISDTVGFIQQLPHHLIDAFKSTLAELQFADLLLQVVDVSDPNWQDHIAVVHEILHDLDINKPMLYVLNKVDRAENLGSLQIVAERYQPHVFVSALSKEHLQPLIDFLGAWNPVRSA